MDHIVITTPGIKSALRNYNEYQAIAEYIWNGFDAGATTVDLNYASQSIGGITEISIKDNGAGIAKPELRLKFKPFYESEKALEFGHSRNNSQTHGKNGVGRLTFFKFANQAVWETVSERNGQCEKFQINVDENSLESYESTSEQTCAEKTGTQVSFYGIKKLDVFQMENDLQRFLEKEFCWFIELNKSKNYLIRVNGEKLNYDLLLGDSEILSLKHKESGTEFKVRYFRWNERLNNEFSKYYYIGSDQKEKWKENTRLNNKGDNFFHSLFIESKYFNDFNFKTLENDGQKTLVGGSRTDEEFKFLHIELVKLLRKKRRPFLKVCAEQLISSYIEEKILPIYDNLSEWEKIRQNELHSTIKGIYQVQPKIFYTLNPEQKKTIVGLLGLIIDSNEKEKLLDIIHEIVELDQDERNDLWKILKTSKLSSVISTIKMIQERQKVIEGLKELVFNPDLNANEVDHVQKIVESNYWIFGEQYHLVTAAEPKFEEALKRYTYLLTGKNEKVVMEDPNKNKEMDVFLCRQRIIDSAKVIENIVIELKSPKIPLGKDELDQIETYMRTIKSESRFNGKNMSWTFILVGNLFKGGSQGRSHIESKITSYKFLGKNSLAAYDADQGYEVYVKTWGEIFNDIDIKHKFINEKLEMQKELLSPENTETADDIVTNATFSAAVII